MALMEISIIPLGLGQVSVGEYIAQVEEYLRRNNIPHQLTDMGTVLSGTPAELFKVAQDLHELPFARGVQRVVTHIAIDDRRDKEVGLGNKTRSVEARLK
ncbi:MAG: MTH1187 family thiamine-binding protein [Deltaproteobacteria bacterium]|nr:MTH1187 family thiamine-binding protein [Deltaproteobacteria bacterium]